MDYPNLSFHVHQILSALSDISNNTLYLPDKYRGTISTSLSALSAEFSEMVSDFDLHSGDISLKEKFNESDKSVDISPFIRTETVEIFDSYIAVDDDGVFTYANPAALTFFGRPDHDLKGKNFWEELPHLKQGPLYPAFQQAVETRLPAHLEMRGIDNRWFAINIHPTRRGVIIYWNDITEKKHIEQALLASEERLRAVIETAPINVFTLDKNLRYVWVGKRRDGFFHEPVIGKRDDELLPAQDAAILMEAERYVLDTGKGLRKEVRFKKGQRNVIYVMQIEPLLDDALGVVGLTIAVMDVTEQRRLEAEKEEYSAQMEMQRRLLERSEMERSELARNLHDGPVQSIVSLGFSLQLIKEILHEDRQGADENIQQLGRDIKNVAAELRRFCNELRPPVLARLGLRKALLENIEEFEQLHPDIQVQAELSEDLSPLPDNTALVLYRIYQHAMINILRHAEASQVRIRLKANQHNILFVIEDDGKGFDEPFNWVENAREGHLGMVGMKERAESVGGTIEVRSQPGEGATLQVRIPLENQKRGTGG